VQRKNLGEMLVAANLIDEVQMEVALAEQVQTGKKFGSTLVDLKFIDENVLAAFLSKQIDVPCISLLHIDIPKKVLRKVPRRIAYQCHSIPIRISEGRLEVAMVDPTDVDLIDILESASGMTVTPLIAPQSSINKMIERFYPEEPNLEDTFSGRKRTEAATAADPLFTDLIEEIESGDFEMRLERIEDNLKQIWSLLERMVQTLEEKRKV